MPQRITRDGEGRLLINGAVPVDPSTGAPRIDGKTPKYNRSMPRRKRAARAAPSAAVKALRLIEPEPIEDDD